jgi:hypothetical protein
VRKSDFESVEDPPEALLRSMEADVYPAAIPSEQRRSTALSAMAPIFRAPMATTPTVLDLRLPEHLRAGKTGW